MLPSKIIFADIKIKEAFYKLENGPTENKELYTFLMRAFKDIERNAFCGTNIPKKLIPNDYLTKYCIDNLWKYDLPGAWRLIYSIEREDIKIISLILEWFDHKDYERKFKY